MNEKELEDRRTPKMWNEMYMELLANPMDLRTDTEFCNEIGISISALKLFKTTYRKSIFEEVQKRRASYINELRTAAYKALAKKMDKDTNALKLALQVMGDLVERTETKVEMTENEKLKRIESLRNSTESRAKAWERAGISPNGPSSEGPGPTA